MYRVIVCLNHKYFSTIGVNDVRSVASVLQKNVHNVKSMRGENGLPWKNQFNKESLRLLFSS